MVLTERETLNLALEVFTGKTCTAQGNRHSKRIRHIQEL